MVSDENFKKLNNKNIRLTRHLSVWMGSIRFLRTLHPVEKLKTIMYYDLSPSTTCDFRALRQRTGIQILSV